MEANDLTQGQAIVESMVRAAAARLGVSVEALEWGSDPGDSYPGLLACTINGQRSVERFSRENLSDAPAAPDVRKLLAERISSWLARIEPAKRIGFQAPPSA